MSKDEAVKLIAWMYDHVMQMEGHHWVAYTGAHLTHEEVFNHFKTYHHDSNQSDHTPDAGCGHCRNLSKCKRNHP
jgi:hypothetical protein